MQIIVRVEGARAIERELKALPRRVRGRPLVRAVRKTLAPVLNSIRAVAPRDTGQMKRSIRTVVKRSRRGGQATGIVGRIGFGRKGSQANLLELGTANQDGTERISALHWVYNAFKRHDAGLVEKFGQNFWDAMKRESQRR